MLNLKLGQAACCVGASKAALKLIDFVFGALENTRAKIKWARDVRVIIKRSATVVNAVSASITSPRSAARAAYSRMVNTGAKSPSAFAGSKAVSILFAC